MSHKGITQRALPAFGGKNVKKLKIKVFYTHRLIWREGDDV